MFDWAPFGVLPGALLNSNLLDMKYETLFLMVRVVVHADHSSSAEIVAELEHQSTLVLTDTANINVLETEILVSRIRNTKVHKPKSHEKLSLIPNGQSGS